MTIEFTQARRENVSTLIALAGASGSGKTYSALRLAKGMAPSGTIFMVDTEARRGLHYADQFDFKHHDMRPPFRPEAFAELAKIAEDSGADVIIFDSFSHEHDGPGGVIDMADEAEARGVKPPGNWREPKIIHRRMVSSFLQRRCSLIFCLRADEKIEIVREGGKTQVRPLGWVPICEKRFMYEMTASFTLTPNAPGKPHFDLPHKLQEQHRPFFPAGKHIDEAAGASLAAWARGGTGAAAEIEKQIAEAKGGARTPELPEIRIPKDVIEDSIVVGHKKAEGGITLLQTWWQALSPNMRRAIGPAQLESWKRTAADAGEGSK